MPLKVEILLVPGWDNLYYTTATLPNGETATCGLARTDFLSALGAFLFNNQALLGIEVVEHGKVRKSPEGTQLITPPPRHTRPS